MARLRWPRRIMVSMTSLRNRLAEGAVSQLAAPLKVLLGDLERILKKLGERKGHEPRMRGSWLDA
jgi:hypothetical protein